MKYRRALEQCPERTNFSLFSPSLLFLFYDNKVGTHRRCISNEIRGRGKINERLSFRRKRRSLLEFRSVLFSEIFGAWNTSTPE